MAEYIVKLTKRNAPDAHVPQVTADAVTEFEAAAIGLNRLRERGEDFSAETGVEILQGNVTSTMPVPVRNITSWLRNRPEGRALVERDGLQPLLDYVKE
jgi:hypothetical protein